MYWNYKRARSWYWNYGAKNGLLERRRMVPGQVRRDFALCDEMHTVYENVKLAEMVRCVCK